VYNPDVPVKYPYLTITPPNFSTAYTLEYPTASLIAINSNLFGWTNTMQYQYLTELPDGHYKIEQSVGPNCLIKRTYNYFRITSLKSTLMNKVAELFEINKSCFDCNQDDEYYKKTFQYLQWLEQAKYMAENCNKIEEAKIIYNRVLAQCIQSEC
jgi:hypothetical protein